MVTSPTSTQSTFSFTLSRNRKLTTDWHKEIHKPLVAPLVIRKSKAELVEAFHPHFQLFTKPAITLPSGSSYKGQHNVIGFSGLGAYTFASGAVYEGYFKDGQFHGEGTITFPKGQQLDGTWSHGKLIKSKYKFADGLQQGTHLTYCQLPDRSFATEMFEGLNPAGKEQLTNKLPTKKLKPSCYDTIDGYYDPATKIVYKDDDSILRVVKQAEEKTIIRNYRVGAELPVGCRLDLYEFWTTGKSSEIEQIMSHYSMCRNVSEDPSFSSGIYLICQAESNPEICATHRESSTETNLSLSNITPT